MVDLFSLSCYVHDASLAYLGLLDFVREGLFTTHDEGETRIEEASLFLAWHGD